MEQFSIVLNLIKLRFNLLKNLMFLIRKQTLFKNSVVKKVTRCILRFLVVNSNFKSLNLRKKRIAICIKI